MTLLNIRGKPIKKNVTKYLVDWDGKCKSIIQFKVKQFLKPFWTASIVYEEFPVYGTKLTVDILNASYKIAIEVQGPQHSRFHYFHGGETANYRAGFRRDIQKAEWLEKNGFKLVEINYDEIESLSCTFFKDKFDVDL